MTNEQLRFLLRQISWRIRQLSQDIEPFITEGSREIEMVWIGEGEPPIISFNKNDKNWESRETGPFVAVQMVEDFAASLEDEAEMLISNGK